METQILIPKNIHFIWLQGDPPQRLKNNILSFYSLNPDWRITLWDEAMVKDLGLDIDWARRVFPYPAGLANAARLFILAQEGGVFFDCDFQCRLPIDGLFPEGATAVAAFQPPVEKGIICNAFMGAVPNHQWILWQKENINRYEGYNPEWGPYAASKAPREGLTIIPSHLVYPYAYDAPEHLRVPHPETIATHLWEHSWK